MAAATVEKANTWIVTSLFISGTMVTISEMKDGNPPGLRLAIGLTTAGVMLGVLAQAAPRMAIGLSGLVLVSSVLVAGKPVLDTLTRVLGGSPGQTGSTARRIPQPI